MNDDFPITRSPARRFAMPVLTIAALAAAFALGFWVLTSLQALETRGTENGGRVNARLAELETRAAALVDAQSGLASQLATLTGSRRDTLFAAETAHLVRLAGQRLALFQDPQGADAMLAAAEHALREIRGADTHAARTALAHDRAQLRDLAAFDVESAWLRLATLPDRVDQLAAPGTKRGAPPTGSMPDASPPAAATLNATASETSWERFVRSVRSLIVLRRVDESLAPALTANERLLAADHFRLLIEQAQLALLQHRDAIYHDALKQAARQLERITTGDPLLLSRMQQELAALNVLAARTPPALDNSLAAVQSLVTQLSKADGAAP